MIIIFVHIDGTDTSMEKLRHCCENLNLFSYILNCFDNTKSRKMNVQLRHVLQSLMEKIFSMYINLHQSIFTKTTPKKNCSLILLIAIYLSPLILILQLLTVVGLMILEPSTPGFIFLITATMCIGCISMKILFHYNNSVDRRKETI